LICPLSDHSAEPPHKQILERGRWSLGDSPQYRSSGRAEHQGPARAGVDMFCSERAHPLPPYPHVRCSWHALRNQAIDAPWTASDAEATAIENWLRQTVHHAARRAPLAGGSGRVPESLWGQAQTISRSPHGPRTPFCATRRSCARRGFALGSRMASRTVILSHTHASRNPTCRETGCRINWTSRDNESRSF
jgi:hypothetical protein